MAEKGFMDRLVAAFAEMRNPPLDSTNPHFRNKFASLLALTNIVRPALAKHGLGCRFTYERDGEVMWVVLVVYSGEDSMELSRCPSEYNRDPQKNGSAYTYAKRYCLQAAFCLVGDEDDDAEAATRPQGSAKAKGGTSARKAPQRAADGPTEAEKAELAEIAAAYGDKRDVWNAYQANGMEGARALLAMVAPAPQVELADADIEFGAAS